MIMHIDHLSGIQKNFARTLYLQKKYVHRVFNPGQRRGFVDEYVFFLDFPTVIVWDDGLPGVATDNAFPFVFFIKD